MIRQYANFQDVSENSVFYPTIIIFYVCPIFIYVLFDQSLSMASSLLSGPVRMVTVMLVTSLCWWLDDCDHFKMLSPTSKSCHQHIWFPTSVTNMNVSVRMDNGGRKYALRLLCPWFECSKKSFTQMTWTCDNSSNSNYLFNIKCGK